MLVYLYSTPMSLYLHAGTIFWEQLIPEGDASQWALWGGKCHTQDRNYLIELYKWNARSSPSWQMIRTVHKCMHVGSREHYDSPSSARPFRLSSLPSPDGHHHHHQISRSRSSQLSYTWPTTAWRSSYTCNWRRHTGDCVLSGWPINQPKPRKASMISPRGFSTCIENR